MVKDKREKKRPPFLSIDRRIVKRVVRNTTSVSVIYLPKVTRKKDSKFLKLNYLRRPVHSGGSRTEVRRVSDDPPCLCRCLLKTYRSFTILFPLDTIVYFPYLPSDEPIFCESKISPLL